MIGRAIWLAAIAAVAIVTTFIQFDRQARVAPGLATMVPEPFRAFAQARIALSALQGDDAELALEEARRLVARRPIPAENLRLLSAAQFQAGEPEDAAVTIQIAAKRGWRDRLAQEAVLRLALAAGDGPEAARRYAALFSNTYTPDELLLELGPQVLGDGNRSGIETFIDIVSTSDRRLSTLLTRGSRVLPGDAFVETVKKSRERGADYSCEELRKALRLLQPREPQAAAALESTFPQSC